MGQRYHRMENQKSRPKLACNLDFTKGKGLEPKVKNCPSWETWWANLFNPNLSQTGVWGGQPWPRLCNFGGGNSYVNTIWMIFRTFLEPFEMAKFLTFESQFEKSNWWVFPLLTDQVQTTFKILNLGVKFCKWLGPRGRSKVLCLLQYF